MIQCGAGQWYLYIVILTSMLQGIVSKYKKKEWKVLYPATIPHGDVIWEMISIVLRGKQVCIKGHDHVHKCYVLGFVGISFPFPFPFLLVT